jgi:hypothetical protein
MRFAEGPGWAPIPQRGTLSLEDGGAPEGSEVRAFNEMR